MCSVSMVTDYFTDRGLRGWQDGRADPFWKIRQMDHQTATDLKEVLRKLDEIDKKLKEPECSDDRKDKFFEALEKRIAELESKVEQIMPTVS